MLISIATAMITVPTTIDRIGRSLPKVREMISWKQTMTNGLAAV